MPRFCANLSMMYNEHDFLDRFKAAAEDGFEGVEYLFPYAHAKEDIKAALDANGLEQVLFNMPPGDWEAGERGIASLPGREDAFAAGVDEALAYAKALGNTMIHAMAGIPKNVDHAQAHATYVENLRRAAPKLADAGIKLVLEPINHFDMPGFFLNTQAQGLAVIEEVGADNIWLQFDIYHQQRTGGELAKTFTKYKDRVAHVQLADNPGRNEPGTGEINYPFLFETLDEEGYDGWIGCEYKPKGDTREGLGWFKRYAN